MKINVAKSLAPAFDTVFWDVQKHQHTYYWLAGAGPSDGGVDCGYMRRPEFLSKIFTNLDSAKQVKGGVKWDAKNSGPCRNQR